MVDKELKSWLNRELNIMLEQVKGLKRYDKKWFEGAIHQQKKVLRQIRKLREHKKVK